MPATEPTRIGKYDVLSVLGRGGMGVVYKAIDPQIGRPVAIKVLLADFDSDDMLRRFYSEAQSTGQLQHPNIVTLYELGDRDGAPYLVMEFLEGESLDKIVASQRQLPLTMMLSIVSQVCIGLHYAHRRNIIHRDIKPGNVVLLPDGSIKLVDFGIAKYGNDRQTRTGMVIGSVKYMSPEQISGAAVDARSDVYSAGVLLYELITHRVPFEGADIGSTIHKVLTSPVPELTQILPNVPPRVDEILRVALAKKPEDRFQTAEDFAFDLTQLQDSLKQDLLKQHLDSIRAAIVRRDWAAATGELKLATHIDRQSIEAHDLSREIRIVSGAQPCEDRVRGLLELAERALKLHRPEDVLRICNLGLEVDPACTRFFELQRAIATSGIVEQVSPSRARNGAAEEASSRKLTAESATMLVGVPPTSARIAPAQHDGSAAFETSPNQAISPGSEQQISQTARGGIFVAMGIVVILVGAISIATYRWRTARQPHATPPAFTAAEATPTRPPAVSPSASPSPSDLKDADSSVASPIAPPPLQNRPSSGQRIGAPNPASDDSTTQADGADRRAWHKIEKNPTLDNIDQFLQSYPSSPLRAQVESRRAQLLRANEDAIWNQTQASGNAAALNDYLARYPAGKYTQSARERLARLDSQAIDSANDAVTLEALLNKYPSGDLHVRVVNRLDDLTWEQSTKNSVGVNAYLSRFPNGRHAAQALSILQSAQQKQLRSDIPSPSSPVIANESTTPAISGAPAVDDKAAIMAILSSYQQAYNHQDLAGIERLWPGMPGQLRKSTADLFNQVKSIQMAYQVLSGPDVTGADAVLRLSETVSFSLGGAPKTRAAKVEVKLRKAGTSNGQSNWHIDSMH